MQINSSTYQHMCRNPHLGQENLLVDFQAQYLVRNNGLISLTTTLISGFSQGKEEEVRFDSLSQSQSKCKMSI